MTPHEWDRRKPRNPDADTKRAMSELLLERLMLWGRIVGVVAILAGLVMLAFTAPPLGGPTWDPNEAFLIGLLMVAGLLTVIASQSPPRY